MALSYVYVCDESHIARLVISLESLRRLGGGDIFVVDYGLDPTSRRKLESVYSVTAIDPVNLHCTKYPRRLGAYREKTVAAGRAAMLNRRASGPIVLMDTDIIVLDSSFLDVGKELTDGDIAMARSAWDKDFNWTYTPDALQIIRTVSGVKDFAMDWEIPNSG